MQTLQPPAAEIPIEGMWTGGFVHPLFHIDQQSGRVVVAQRVETVGVWERFLYDLPDWAFFVCVAAVLLFAWKMWRTARSPRSVGRLVCVRCAYDLTPANGAAVVALCPECGADTVKRPPVLGRTFARRMVWPVALTAAVLGGGLAVFFWRLEPVRPFDRTRPWPPLISQSLSGWMRLQRRQPAVVMSERIDVWSAADGRVVSRTNIGPDTWQHGATIRQVRLLPGGEYVAVTSEDTGIALSVLRASDGSVVWKSSANDWQGGVAGLAGASNDGKRVWFWGHRRTSAQGGETELIEADLQSGASRSLGKVAHSQEVQGWRGAEVVAAQEGDGVVWASVVSSSSGAELAWPGGRATLTTPVAADRSVLQPGADGRGGWSILIPDTGSAVAPSGWKVALSEPTPIPGRLAILTLTATGTQLDVGDANGAVLKSLSTAGAVAPVLRNAIPGQRWYGAIGMRAVPPRKYLGVVEVGGTFNGVVQVWDISVPAGAKNP